MIGGGIISRKKLTYHFHNPNSDEETVDYILKIFFEVNKTKLDRILQEESKKKNTENNSIIKEM